jgi:hypothetical protein
MRFLPLTSRAARSTLWGALALALIAGCTNIPQVIDTAVTVNSCTGNALAMRVTGTYGPFVTGISWNGGSSNIVGTPTINDYGISFEVIAELNHVSLGEPVTLDLLATAIVGSGIGISDVEFFTVPPDSIVGDGCKAGSSPEFGLANTQGAVKLELTAPAEPLILGMLQLAESPDVLSPSSLDWSDPVFNALSWHDAVVGATPLDPAGPPLVVDLPGTTTPGTKAVLCRFTSIENGMELRGIVQTQLTGPLASEPTTWGAVKALYRSRE